MEPSLMPDPPAVGTPRSLEWSSSWGPAPRFATPRTPERPTFGPAVAEIAELLGTPLFASQQYVFDVGLEVQSEEAGDPEPGAWAYDEVDDFEPRRAGKTFKVGPLVAHRCGSAPDRSAWMTAQKRNSAVRRWDRVRLQLMASRSPLRGMLKATVGDGHEAVRWRETGSEFLPFAPKHDAMHGEEPDLVVVDELWAHDLAAKSAIEQGYKPAWLVKPGQAWLLSAAGTEASEWLNLARRQGRAGVAERRLGRAIFDWCVPDEVGGVPVEELPDHVLLDVVLDCHPRRDNGLRVGYLTQELGEMGRVDFLRAFGNRTATRARSTVIELGAWSRAWSRARIPRQVRVGIGFTVDPERREGAVWSAWRGPNGLALTEGLRCEPGTRWMAPYLVERIRKHRPAAVAVNNVGPARDIADEVERLAREEGVQLPVLLGSDDRRGLLRVGPADYAAACARVADEMGEPAPTVTHDGNEQLTAAMKATGRRPLAGGRVWAALGEEPVTAMEAHTLAVWAFDHAPVERRFRIA